MAFSFAKFAEVIAGITDSVRSTIPKSVLFPLSTTSILLLLIWGHTHDWQRFDTYWKETTVFEKGVVGAGIALLFVLIALILSEFQPTLTRWFLGDWPMGTGWYRRARERYYTDKRARNSATLEQLDAFVGVFNEIERMVENATSTKTVTTARRRIQQFERIIAEDIETRTNGVTTTSESQYVGAISLKTFARGEKLAKEHVLRPSKPLPETSLKFVPVRIESSFIPGTIAAGDYVTVFARSIIRTTRLSSEPWLVVTAKSAAADGSNGSSAQLLTFAVPEDEVVRLIDSLRRRLAVVAEQRHSDVPGVAAASPAGATSAAPPSGTAARIAEALEKVEHHWVSQLESRKVARLKVASDALKNDSRFLARLLESGSTVSSKKLPSFEIVSGVKQEDLDWNDSADVRRILAIEYVKILKPLRDARDDWAGDIQPDFLATFSTRNYEISATSAGNILLAAQDLTTKTYGARIDLILPALRASLSDKSREQLTLAEERFSLLQWTWVGLLVTAVAGTAIAWTGHHPGTAAIVWGTSLLLMLLVGGKAMNNAAQGFADALRLAVTADRSRVLAFYGLALPSGKISSSDERPMWDGVHQLIAFGQSLKTYQLAGGGGSADASKNDA